MRSRPKIVKNRNRKYYLIDKIWFSIYTKYEEVTIGGFYTCYYIIITCFFSFFLGPEVKLNRLIQNIHIYIYTSYRKVDNVLEIRIYNNIYIYNVRGLTLYCVVCNQSIDIYIYTNCCCW